MASVGQREYDVGEIEGNPLDVICGFRGEAPQGNEDLAQALLFLAAVLVAGS